MDILIGPRQSGKTTSLLRKIKSDIFNNPDRLPPVLIVMNEATANSIRKYILKDEEFDELSGLDIRTMHSLLANKLRGFGDVYIDNADKFINDIVCTLVRSSNGVFGIAMDGDGSNTLCTPENYIENNVDVDAEKIATNIVNKINKL